MGANGIRSGTGQAHPEDGGGGPAIGAGGPPRREGFRPGLHRIPWRLFRFLSVSVIVLVVSGVMTWSGRFVLVLGLLGAFAMLLWLSLAWYEMLRHRSPVAVAVAVGGAVVVVGLWFGTFDGGYMQLRGERVSATLTPVCEGTGGRIKCRDELRHPDGRVIVDDFAAGDPTALGGRPIPPGATTVEVYWDPAGLLHPRPRDSVERSPGLRASATALALLAGGSVTASLYGELYRRRHSGERPARRSGRLPSP